MPMKTEKPGVFRAWVLASRPKTLAAAVPALTACKKAGVPLVLRPPFPCWSGARWPIPTAVFAGRRHCCARCSLF